MDIKGLWGIDSISKIKTKIYHNQLYNFLLQVASLGLY